MKPHRSLSSQRIQEELSFTSTLRPGSLRVQKNINQEQTTKSRQKIIIMHFFALYYVQYLKVYKNIISKYKTQMDKEQEKPEKRFEDYQEVFSSEGAPIGFTLPDTEFIFKYDAEGGWKDEKGNYYNSKGVLQKINDEHSQDQEQVENEQQLEQFQKMLDDNHHGTRKKQNANEDKKQKKPIQPKQILQDQPGLVQAYKKKQNVREGLPEELHIYFKMRTKYYQRVKPVIEKAQSVNEINAQVKKVKAHALEELNKLKEKNKWLSQAGQFEYSGTQLDQATYDRYWYGFVKANPQNYKQIISQIQKSAEFALLEHKTYYALQSKFYLKKKMREKIGELRQIIKDKEDNDLILIKISNLPENFPCSIVLDLCTYSGTPIQQVFSISIIDQFSADLILSKKGAQKFINVEGYCHDHKQFIQLDVEVGKENRKLKSEGFFKISVAINKQNPYKTHVRQLQDTLGLEKSRQQHVKIFSQQQEKENGGFRFIVGKSVLKKVLMFRGQSLDVLKVQAFSK